MVRNVHLAYSSVGRCGGGGGGVCSQVDARMEWYTGVCYVGRSTIETVIIAAKRDNRRTRYEQGEGIDVYRSIGTKVHLAMKMESSRRDAERREV